MSGALYRGGDAGVLTLLLERLGDQEGELDRLGTVQPRIAAGVVASGEVDLADRLRAAGAFGDVLAGQLEMHAAGIGALGAVDLEEALELGQDAVELAGLVAGGRLDRVAVHRVGRPHDAPSLALDGADQRRQVAL